MSNEDGSDSLFRIEFDSKGAFHLGSTLPQRAYAAIHLRVPDSGLPWLDAMIERARQEGLVADEIDPDWLKHITLLAQGRKG